MRARTTTRFFCETRRGDASGWRRGEGPRGLNDRQVLACPGAAASPTEGALAETKNAQRF